MVHNGDFGSIISQAQQQLNADREHLDNKKSELEKNRHEEERLKQEVLKAKQDIKAAEQIIHINDEKIRKLMNEGTKLEHEIRTLLQKQTQDHMIVRKLEEEVRTHAGNTSKTASSSPAKRSSFF